MQWGEQPMRAHERLVTDALARASGDPDAAARELAVAAISSSIAGEARATLKTLALAETLAGRAGPDTRVLVAIHRVVIDLLLNRPGRNPLDLQTEIERLDPTDSLVTAEALREYAVALLWAEDYEGCRALLERLIEIARMRSWPASPLMLDTLASLEFRTGHWTAADAYAAEAIRLSELGAGPPTFVLASALTTLARVDAARARESPARAALQRAREIASPGGLAAAYAATAAGLLELSLDRPEQAIAELEATIMGDDAPLGPMVLQAAPDLVEAYVRADRSSDAMRAYRRFEADAAGIDKRWVQAAQGRCRGMIMPARSWEDGFREALATYAQLPTPFARARTELSYGERLRRTRRADDATPHLRAAAIAFDGLGAPSWAARARRELDPHRTFRIQPALPITRLSPRERQVAAFIGNGATNHEIATALFLSEKAVEYHLGNAYQKLGVRSRTELAVLLERQSEHGSHNR